MTSNAAPLLNPSSISAGTLDDRSRSPSAPRPDDRAASPPSSKEPAAPKETLQNGPSNVDDAAGESEAETVVLGPTDDGCDKGEKKTIKTERTDDDDAARLRSVREASRVRSPATNGRRASRDEKDSVKLNGAKHGSERDAKSPPTSPSSRTPSRHTKETSPADSAKSPAHSAASPPQPSARGRSSSTVENRKRKLRDESNPKALEPPRQKAKTEGLKDLRQPTSPANPVGRPHKRSQSTQSIATSAAGRKRRELTALALPERKNWSDDSSENSSSPRPAKTPNLPPHTRLKRSSHRALTSPARAMPHGRKVDKFGATRLARESEKGDLSAVKAAYEASPDELDHDDFAGITPLQKASLHGWADIVEYLISVGCRTDCESNDRDTPLIDAVENGHLDVVKLLLDKGKVNPHHQNKKGQRAIDVLDHEDADAEDIEKELKAAMRREVDTTTNDEYSQSGPNTAKSASRLLYNEYNTETLIEKAGDGDILAVGELINSNIKPNIACGVAAARGGHYDILSILLASGLKADPDPSKHSETPMLVAIGRGHLKIVTLLLEQDNFDPTRRNRDGKAYFEISEDRRGPKWEQERDILKQAYDTFRLTHKSPRRSKKEAPHPIINRMKRKSSPLRRERSSSPRPEAKRAHLTKSTTVPQAPQKSRRLLSGKEMANREVKRRRRVVNDESSESDSDDEVRAPARKKAIKPRSFSDGEGHKPVKKIKARSEEHDVGKRAARAQSHDSDHEPRRKAPSKIRTRTEKVSNAKDTPDPESPDEKRPVKNKIRSRPLEDAKLKKRRASNDSLDDRVKKTSTASAKSTPAPPERTSTPDSVRERRLEEQKQKEKEAAEAKRKAEEAARKKAEEEAAREAARKAAEEEEARKRAEAEAEAKRIAEEEEAARKAAEEEARRLAEEEVRRQQELAARQQRVANLPRALRRACELGNNRPLHFSGEELGISAVFLPLFYTTSQDLRPDGPATPLKTYIPSFQVVGILGLSELDIARLEAPYSEWDRIPMTPKQRDLVLRQYDVALLAQDFRFPMEGTPDFDYARIQQLVREARQQFLEMEGLYWIEDECLYPEVEKVEGLRPLLEEIKDLGKKRRIHVKEEVEDKPEKKHKPRKSFLDTVLAQNGVNGIAGRVNGEG